MAATTAILELLCVVMDYIPQVAIPAAFSQVRLPKSEKLLNIHEISQPGFLTDIIEHHQSKL
jgi:hypothetical protein